MSVWNDGVGPDCEHVNSVQGWFGKTDFDKYTDEQCHAELYYAENSMFLAVLTMLEDRSFTGFINGALYIRAAYSAYKTVSGSPISRGNQLCYLVQCNQMLENKSNWSSEYSKMQFESGARFGSGIFDIGISFLPNRLTTLLEYVGFSGDRDKGLKQLDTCCRLIDSNRFPIVVGAILFYFMVDDSQGLAEGDKNMQAVALENFVKRYPEVSRI